MDILVNIKSLQPPVTGIGRYTAGLLNYLILENRVQAFDPVNCYSEVQLKEKLKYLDDFSNSRQKQENVSSFIRNVAKKLPYAYKIRSKIQQKITQNQFKQCKNHIYWEPNYILEKFDGKSVSTIHDLSYLRYPEFNAREVRQWLECNLEASINAINLDLYRATLDYEVITSPKNLSKDDLTDESVLYLIHKSPVAPI
mgnify:CR=1 FL=1